MVNIGRFKRIGQRFGEKVGSGSRELTAQLSTGLNASEVRRLKELEGRYIVGEKLSPSEKVSRDRLIKKERAFREGYRRGLRIVGRGAGISDKRRKQISRFFR